MTESEEIISVPAKRGYPTIAQAFGIFGVSILLQVGLSMPLSSFMADYPSLGMLVMYTTFMGLTILFAWKMGNRSSLSFGPLPVSLLPWVILVTPALALLMEPVIASLPYVREFQELMMRMLGDNMLFIFMTVAIAAPILEEVLFRGIILDGFLKNYSPWKAIIWSAVIFGLVHMNPYQFIVAMMIGIIMGWIYWKTRSLWLCILIHFINNSTGFVLHWLFDLPIKEFTTTRDLMTSDSQYVMLLAGCLVVLGLSLFMLYRGMKGDEMKGINSEV